MKLKKMISLCLVLVLIGAMLPEKTNAAAVDNFMVVSYQVQKSVSSGKTISKGDRVDIMITLWNKANADSTIGIVRNVDSFSGGQIYKNDGSTLSSGEDLNSSSAKTTFWVKDLVYSGVGQSLVLTISGGGDYQTLTVKINECVEYEKPDTPIVTPPVIEDDDPPTACPAPRMIFSIDRPTEPIAAGQDMTLTVYVYNAGTVTIKKPILTLTPSSGLMLTGGVSAFLLDDIAPKKEKSVTVSAQTLSKIDAQSQGLDCELSFTYYNNISTVDGTASGKLTIPALTSEIEEETTDAKPVPRIILTGYNHGGSIAAGSEQKVSFTFKNTSSTMAIENILLTVTGGSELAISGSTNTFYFESVEAGGSRSVSVPFRASRIVTSPTQDVGLDFEFEYVEGSNRKTGAAKLNISVPLYQPDRFELSEPVAAYVGYVGEETSLTMDYVNKGKSEVCNVEARISGDVDSYNSFVRVGNIASGKNGTIAFAVTPMLEGDNKAIITVSYEDVNGEVKERIFETTLSAMAMEPFDPGEWEDPLEPVDEGNGFPWWIVGIVLAVATIVIGIVVSRKKKKAKLAKEQALWDDWDEEANTEKKAEALPETAGVGAEGTDK